MAELRRNVSIPTTGGRAQSVEIDEGLRSYMLRVYNYMAAGVALTGVVAYAVANWAMSSPAVAQALYGSPLRWLIIFAPLIFVMVLSFGINRMSVGAAQLTFWAFAAVMGLSLSSIFLVFKLGSIANIFFVSAAAFASLSLFGYVTKKDLSGFGTFLFMGLIGIILASIVNIFVGSSALQFAVSVIGVLVFAGLTAYDTQNIKNTYYMVQNDVAAMGKSAVMGALNLYLDFINMFTFLLSLFGQRE